MAVLAREKIRRVGASIVVQELRSGGEFPEAASPFTHPRRPSRRAGRSTRTLALAAPEEVGDGP